VFTVASVRPLIGPTQLHTGRERERKRERLAERQLLPSRYSPKVLLRYSIEASSRILLLHSTLTGQDRTGYGKEKE
jgi:hypothetical protein